MGADRGNPDFLGHFGYQVHCLMTCSPHAETTKESGLF